MSGMTLPDLLAFDAGPWQAAAQGWRRLAESVDDADDQLTRGTRDLPEAWRSGTAAQAAAAKAATLCTRVRDAYDPVKNIGDQLDLHGYAMTGLRVQAEQIVAQARQAGYTVDTAAGTISAPAVAYTGGNLEHTARETGALLRDLRSVLERARAQDTETARVLNGNAPSGPGGAGAARAGAIARAEELATKIKNPSYRPTTAELTELRDLIRTHGKDKVFSYELLTTLGPKGVLELSGTLATLQLDHPGQGDGPFHPDKTTAELVRGLQNGLGTTLATATDQTGTRTGLRGETYTPGPYELPEKWVSDLTVAGRSKMDIGDPSDPLRRVEGVYGYQVLSPLLHNSDLDPAFVATVGGDIIDFEREQGQNSALWRPMRGENIRLDWTQGHDDSAPAGYDPVTALMDGLSRNGDGTREMLTAVTESSTDPRAPDGGRLPRLTYLLTDRNWEADVPGGPGWTATAMQHGDEFKKSGIDDLGFALERATIDHPGSDARHIVEAIIFESTVDEQAAGAANGADPQEDSEADFMKTDVINPEIRDSMARITSAYILDVNANIADADYPSKHMIDVDRQQLVRFLGDIGKDADAHAIVSRAEAAYSAAANHYILSGQQNPDADMDANIRAMKVVSQNYGSVMGTLDLGATEAGIATSADRDAQANASLETRYRVVGPLVEGAVGVVTSPIPGGSDLANAVVGDALEDLEELQKADSSGAARFQVGEVLGAGRTTAVDITEASLYESDKLEKLPPELRDEQGDLIPMSDWTENEIAAWRFYKESRGFGVVGDTSLNAGNAYQLGYQWAQSTLIPKVKQGEGE